MSWRASVRDAGRHPVDVANADGPERQDGLLLSLQRELREQHPVRAAARVRVPVPHADAHRASESERRRRVRTRGDQSEAGASPAVGLSEFRTAVFGKQLASTRSGFTRPFRGITCKPLGSPDLREPAARSEESDSDNNGRRANHWPTARQIPTASRCHSTFEDRAANRAWRLLPRASAVRWLTRLATERDARVSACHPPRRLGSRGAPNKSNTTWLKGWSCGLWIDGGRRFDDSLTRAS
jgi:hypothetical protein